MSLDPDPLGPVPEETARVVRAAFPKGTLYLTLRDELGPLSEDGLFADLFPRRGQPGEGPWRLALVTVLQFAENLPDRQAADAVRGRIDWKYLTSRSAGAPAAAMPNNSTARFRRSVFPVAAPASVHD